MSQKIQPAKRKRGILLSKKGWQRLQSAEMQYVNQHNDGKLLTLQDLSDRTGLSANTLARVRGRKIAVDQQTLEAYFRSFQLTLGVEDYTDSDGILNGRMVLPPCGQLALDSAFYIQRSHTESLFQDALMNQIGGLVQIKAPRQAGKSSLVAKVLSEIRSQSVATVMLNLQLVDMAVIEDLSRFLRWFCAVVTRNLGLENKLDDYWDDLYGSSSNCTHYFESYLLPQIKKPLILVLDDVDVLLQHERVALDFYGMIRTWHEKTRYGDRQSELWQQLRLALLSSIDVPIPLAMHRSLFNTGIVIDLPGFDTQQVEDLLQRYHVADAGRIAQVLIQLLGDNPFLLHWAAYHLSLPAMDIDELLDNATSPTGIYSHHLRLKLADVMQDDTLVHVMQQIVVSPITTPIDPLSIFQLQSQGLARVECHQWVPSCDLYRNFFANVLPKSTLY